MRIACIADLHNYLPKIPQGVDLLLLAGDYVKHNPNSHYGAELRFYNGPFRDWLDEIGDRIPVAMVGGNHDYVFEKHMRLFDGFHNNVYYLDNSGVEINGIRIWGSPQNLWFGGWSFNQRPAEIKKFWDAIPSDTDILICHQPPYGFGDKVPQSNPKEDESIFDGNHVGCHHLLKRIEEIQPQLVVCGHIHNGRGIYQCGKTQIINCSYVDDEYKNPREIIIVDL